MVMACPSPPELAAALRLKKEGWGSNSFAVLIPLSWGAEVLWGLRAGGQLVLASTKICCAVGMHHGSAGLGFVFRTPADAPDCWP